MSRLDENLNVMVRMVDAIKKNYGNQYDIKVYQMAEYAEAVDALLKQIRIFDKMYQLEKQEREENEEYLRRGLNGSHHNGNKGS